MYTCGFTLAPRVQVDHHKTQYIIWEKGVGSTSDLAAAPAFDTNKIEVLRLLLVLFSRQIYVSSAGLFSKPSLYTLHFVQKIPRRDVLTILCSLLNTAVNSAAPVVSLGSMAGKLPYNHLVFKGEDPRVALTGMCLQILCVLLDFQGGSARDIMDGVDADGNPTATPTARTNAFRYFLMKLHRTQDFEYILTGINGILLQLMNSMNKLLPGSRKPLPYIPETIILFWKMIELNAKFRAYFLESEKSMDLISYLLCYCVEIKDKPAAWALQSYILYYPGFIRGTRVWRQARLANASLGAHHLERRRDRRRFLGPRDLRHHSHHIRLAQRAVSRAHHRSVQLCAAFPQAERDRICMVCPAVCFIRESRVLAVGRRPSATVVLYARGV